jgi:hypothetical protein
MWTGPPAVKTVREGILSQISYMLDMMILTGQEPGSIQILNNPN